MSSPETQMMAALAAKKAKASAELEQIEAAMFRFSHRVRAFLAAWPDDMPAPISIHPSFDSQTSDITGEPYGKSYVQMVYMGREGVEAWAARWGVDVVCDPSAFADGSAHVTAGSCVEGLRVLASCIEATAVSAGDGDA